MTEPRDHYRALPADGCELQWETWDREHAEQLTLRWENEAWTATGRVARERVEYVVRLSPLWQVRQFLLFRDLPEPDLWLGTDGHGRWGEMNGAHRPELDGAYDVVLDVTPFTLSLPIRRLPLHVGDGFEIPVLRVDVETLAVEPTMMAYHRTARDAWRITGPRGPRVVTVDEHGLVVDVDGGFRRV